MKVNKNSLTLAYPTHHLVLICDRPRQYRAAELLALAVAWLWTAYRIGDQMIADLDEWWTMVVGEVVDEWALLVNELLGESGVQLWVWLIRLEITGKIVWWGLTG
jgi:hypothetical protein